MASSRSPAGLTLNATIGQITGTPPSQTAAATNTITAQNSAGSTNFDLTLAVIPPAPTTLSYPSPRSYLLGAEIGVVRPTVTA